MGGPAFRVQKTTGLDLELDPRSILEPGDFSPSGILRASLASNMKLRLNTFDGDSGTLTSQYHVAARAAWDARVARAEKLRKEIVRIALDEWNFWQQDHGLGTTPTEGDNHEGSKRVRKYWAVVNRNKNFTLAQLKSEAWSAAFISYVMKKAGAGRDFKRAMKHTHFFYHAKQARKKLFGPLFKAYPASGPGAVRPDVGDVIANETSETKSYDTLESTGHSHSDIVVEKRNNVLVVVGGNVATTGTTDEGTVVGKKFVELSSTGFLQHKEITFPDSTQGQKPITYFSVMKIEAETSNLLKPGARR